MKYEAIFKEEADVDVLEAYHWSESRQEGLGESFLDELDEYVDVIEKAPQIYQIRMKNRRYCPLKRFPYVLVYEIENTGLIVYAVFNTYKNPVRLDYRI